MNAGAYIVELSGGDGAQLTIRHPDADEALLATPPGRPFVWAGEGREDVEETAGAFVIEDQTLRACDRQVVSDLRQEGEAAILAGTLEGPDCAAGYEVRLEAAADGGLEIAVDLSAEDGLDRLAVLFERADDERFVGFGVQYSALDMRGRVVPVWVREQGIGRGVEPLSSTLTSLFPGAGGDWHTTYAPVPYTLSSAGRAFALDDSRYSIFDLSGDGVARVEEWTTHMRARMWRGTPLELVAAFSARQGRMDPLPGWAGSGAVVRASGGSQAVRDRVAAFQAAGVPLAAVWIEDWSGERETPLGTRLWWNWEPDAGLYPDWPDLIAELYELGVRSMIYFNPYLADASDKPDAVRNLYAEAVAAGHLVERPDGAIAELSQGGFRAGIVDLTSAGARGFLEDVIAGQLALGVDGFMADFGEGLPVDAALAAGDDAAAFHNLYPVAWARVTESAIQAAGAEDRAIAFHRSGYLGSPAHATLFWIGDQLVTWDAFDGLGTVVPALVSGGLSGFALSHGDIGGYTSIDTGPLEYVRTRELLWRWIELAAFTAFFRTHETPLRDRNVQVDSDPETLAHFARFARLFASLAPYRQQLMEEAARTGAPLTRHLLLHAPDDVDAWDVTDQMMLGPDLLIAPVLAEGAREREVYLPAGRWVHAWSGDELGAPERGMRVTVPAPLGQPPVFVRAGASVGEVFTSQED